MYENLYTLMNGIIHFFPSSHNSDFQDDFFQIFLFLINGVKSTAVGSILLSNHATDSLSVDLQSFKLSLVTNIGKGILMCGS